MTVFLSTMEVYGTPQEDNKIDERYGTDLQTTDIRSCYPFSKIMAEQMLASFCAEYGIKGAALRLTQTFGPGVAYSDSRVFAEFARCVIENQEIVLRTEGLTKRMYLYTVDAVTAILHIMLNEDLLGSRFEVYNVANESTYCSIREMANQFSKVGGKNTPVRIQINDVDAYGYAPTLHMNLDTKKIMETGWRSQYGFRDMIANIIDYMTLIKP
jgi:nucleoside-diphosphate-sugar epimerase